MQNLTKEQAISVLVTGAKIGQAKGAFTLEDASVIMEAIKVLTPKPEVGVIPEERGQVKEEEVLDK